MSALNRKIHYHFSNLRRSVLSFFFFLNYIKHLLLQIFFKQFLLKMLTLLNKHNYLPLTGAPSIISYFAMVSVSVVVLGPGETSFHCENTHFSFKHLQSFITAISALQHLNYTTLHFFAFVLHISYRQLEQAKPSPRQSICFLLSPPHADTEEAVTSPSKEPWVCRL